MRTSFAVIALVSAVLASAEAQTVTFGKCLGSLADTTLNGWVKPLAERYAPVYFAAPTERYLPTLPFFHAFDDLDNNNQGGYDVSDPDGEIAPKGGPDPTKILWDSLNTYHIRLADSGKVPAAIMYHVDSIRPNTADERDLWRFLRNDEQAWKRTKWGFQTMDSLQERMEGHQGFKVLEYYAYYVDDVGLEGHHSDVEPVFVFVPHEVGVDGEVKEQDFRIIVGAGHTQYIPNGVLVLTGPRAEFNVARADTVHRSEARPRIIIEFGDHSSAPDAPPYRRMRPGWDINWYIRYIWGTRDTQASHGLGYLGSYELDQTFPRDPVTRAVRLAPHMAEEREQSGDPNIVPGFNRYYSLVRVEVLQCLFELLADVRSLTTLTFEQEFAFNQVLKHLAGDLGSSQYRRWNVANYTAEFDARSPKFVEAIMAMTSWLGPLAALDEKDVDSMKVRVWESEHYTGKISRIFKAHLFRPTTSRMKEASDWVSWFFSPSPSFGVLSQGRYRFGFGWTIPAIELPVRLPGVLELNFGLYGKIFDGLTGPLGPVAVWERHRPSAWMTYEHHYGQKVTWFLQIAKIWNRGVMDPGRSSWTAEGGLSVGLNPNPKARVRIGPRFDLARNVYADWAIQFTLVH